MTIELNLITGLMLGFEYVDRSDEEQDDDYDGKYVVIDLLILRILFSW